MPPMAWSVETLNETVDAELAGLPADMRARLVRIAELIESVGLPGVKEPTPTGEIELALRRAKELKP